ncbi:hypothetical protein AB0M64_21195 [Streptomyces sp. NPDC051771]|uniref:preATP grasp domain-containing protein n=1 Tax=Streptomyces sp. NPDC051771 TaxID=3154847 RepID=UPI00343FB7BD
MRGDGSAVPRIADRGVPAVCRRLDGGGAPEQTSIIDVPPAGAVPLARSVREAGLTDRIAAHVRQPGTALPPIPLDASVVALARDLGVIVHP